MSTEFDKNFSKWCWYSIDHKNSIEFFFEHFRSKLQNSDFQSHFSMSKIIRNFLFFFIGEYQFRSPNFVKKTFFDNFIFKNNLFLKWCRQIVIFAGLITSTKNVQKSFQCDFCNKLRISFILKSFYQIPLTRSKKCISVGWMSPSFFKLELPIVQPMLKPNLYSPLAQLANAFCLLFKL
jgi:hypothetical protein